MCQSIMGLFAALCIAAVPAAGFAESGRTGGMIAIDSGAPTVEGGTLVLDARASFNLPAVLVTALNKGVHLFFVTEVQILEHRRFLPDKKIIDLRLPRQLRFHALTRKYIIDDISASKRTSFSSLGSALSALGAYEDVVLVKARFAAASQAAYMRMRISLQRSRLPLPLRLKSYFSLPWAMSSDWRQWSL